MKRYQLMLLGIFFMETGASGQQLNMSEIFPIESSHSYVDFSITYMGYAKVRGSFGGFQGTIRYDETDLTKTSVSFQVDVNTINTNNDWRDKDLQSPGWFDAEAFPNIRFSSTGARASGDKLMVTGDLTIKDVTKSITVEIVKPLGVLKDNRDDHQVIFVGSYTLNRKEFHVMGKRWDQVKEGIASLSDEVTVEFSLLGKQIKAANFSNWLRSPRSPQHHIYKAYNTNGTQGALEQYQIMKDTMNVNHHALNMVGYMLIQEGKTSDAITLLTKNTKDFPNEANTFDTLGEALAYGGQRQKAINAYEKSIALDDGNMNAMEILKHLR